jgi:hypothetical protein
VQAPRNAAVPKKTPEPPEETDELSAVSYQRSAHPDGWRPTAESFGTRPGRVLPLQSWGVLAPDEAVSRKGRGEQRWYHGAKPSVLWGRGLCTLTEVMGARSCVMVLGPFTVTHHR